MFVFLNQPKQYLRIKDKRRVHLHWKLSKFWRYYNERKGPRWVHWGENSVPTPLCVCVLNECVNWLVLWCHEHAIHGPLVTQWWGGQGEMADNAGIVSPSRHCSAGGGNSPSAWRMGGSDRGCLLLRINLQSIAWLYQPPVLPAHPSILDPLFPDTFLPFIFNPSLPWVTTTLPHTVTLVPSSLQTWLGMHIDACESDDSAPKQVDLVCQLSTDPWNGVLSVTASYVTLTTVSIAWQGWCNPTSREDWHVKTVRHIETSAYSLKYFYTSLDWVQFVDKTRFLAVVKPVREKAWCNTIAIYNWNASWRDVLLQEQCVHTCVYVQLHDPGTTFCPAVCTVGNISVWYIALYCPYYYTRNWLYITHSLSLWCLVFKHPILEHVFVISFGMFYTP